MPEGFRYVSAELLELQNVEVEAIKSISQVEEIIKSKNIDKFLQLEDTFEQHKAAKQRLAYLTDLHEDFLFEHFLPMLCLPGSKSTFENFEQSHRDSLARLRHRAVVHMIQGAVPVPLQVQAKTCTESELRAIVDTLNTKVEFLFTRVTETEKLNKKDLTADPSTKPIDNKVIADLTSQIKKIEDSLALKADKTEVLSNYNELEARLVQQLESYKRSLEEKIDEEIANVKTSLMAEISQK